MIFSVVCTQLKPPGSFLMEGGVGAACTLVISGDLSPLVGHVK